MSSQASPKRNMKKYARDASRRKFSLNVDLNDPPVMPEIRQPVGASEAAQGRVAAPEVLTSGMAVLPIDVEAIEDDDVQMLSSPRDFNQARNQSRRNRPLVLLDENLELSIGPSGYFKYFS
ncbi:hypothetical protein HPP92_021114 [Vanilla planifolia]|uniref:Uncharacterized protein n=1 Tax=Vanilla planifolia TaxID=51239 RepID=A0A835UIG9_VANPL|nr:hypothetical protein HPP92_021114 [Vanilla planifolia]